MRILLPTGSATEEMVRQAAAGCDADVIVTGEIASFLTPHQIKVILQKKKYDMVIVSGMSTASFEQVERETGVPVYRGPRHAADLSLILPLIEKNSLSKTVPADDFLASQKANEAKAHVEASEREAECDFIIRGVKIGGESRMKVLAEIMDAHRCDTICERVGQFFESGADIVDLGFGFDATPEDVTRVFSELDGIDRPLAADTQIPALIRAALIRADLILSLQEENIPKVGREVAEAGAAAVIVPGASTLTKNITLAKREGVRCIIADPLLQPAGSGLVSSLKNFQRGCHPLFFGAGNVAELIDADSPGINALLAGMAMEVGTAVIFTSEHSDKTRGSVREMRRATEMMALARERPYPKDLGIDLLLLKEKRRRREPPLNYETITSAQSMPDEIEYDPNGNFRIGIEGDRIVAVIHGKAVQGTRWQDVLHTILSQGDVSLLDHAGYLGRELYKAELAIRYGRSFEQDGEF
ncbi:dihydropteroate synthase-like protein [Methanoregula formicica]|uniref:Dihydropteroate synthase-like enzyme n=1 Tax=Methanoregula formicica (strain DSM 22288 / NBRC 105244 / SMSP) TaxID=593750 RepID=L0HLE2_METFS|nr:dihydropteroate synthase-like protein [Methanoregula formicica]AGB03879.1 dihydropteroate synthase-like enzyme [Methanoregula formicica SMSP]